MLYLLSIKGDLQQNKSYIITFVSDQHLSQTEFASVSFDYLIKLFVTGNLELSNELNDKDITILYKHSQTARKTYKLDKTKSTYYINDDIAALRENNTEETIQKAIDLTKKLFLGIQ